VARSNPSCPIQPFHVAKRGVWLKGLLNKLTTYLPRPFTMRMGRSQADDGPKKKRKHGNDKRADPERRAWSLLWVCPSLLKNPLHRLHSTFARHRTLISVKRANSLIGM
jgi:hypothetical protein